MSINVVVVLCEYNEGLANNSSQNTGKETKDLGWTLKKKKNSLHSLLSNMATPWWGDKPLFVRKKERSVLPTTEKKKKRNRKKIRWGGGKEFGSCECRFLLQSSHICNLSCSLLKAKGVQGSFFGWLQCDRVPSVRGLSAFLNTGLFLQLNVQYDH